MNLSPSFSTTSRPRMAVNARRALARRACRSRTESGVLKWTRTSCPRLLNESTSLRCLSSCLALGTPSLNATSPNFSLYLRWYPLTKAVSSSPSNFLAIFRTRSTSSAGMAARSSSAKRDGRWRKSRAMVSLRASFAARILLRASRCLASSSCRNCRPRTTSNRRLVAFHCCAAPAANASTVPTKPPSALVSFAKPSSSSRFFSASTNMFSSRPRSIGSPPPSGQTRYGSNTAASPALRLHTLTSVAVKLRFDQPPCASKVSRSRSAAAKSGHVAKHTCGCDPSLFFSTVAPHRPSLATLLNRVGNLPWTRARRCRMWAHDCSSGSSQRLALLACCTARSLLSETLKGETSRTHCCTMSDASQSLSGVKKTFASLMAGKYHSSNVSSCCTRTALTIFQSASSSWMQSAVRLVVCHSVERGYTIVRRLDSASSSSTCSGTPIPAASPSGMPGATALPAPSFSRAR